MRLAVVYFFIFLNCSLLILVFVGELGGLILGISLTVLARWPVFFHVISYIYGSFYRKNIWNLVRQM